MFPLAGESFPKSADELVVAVRGALAEVFWFPDENSVVTIEGGTWPALQRVKVDLSGAAVRTAQLPPRPEPRGPREPGVTVEQFEVLGRPIRYEQSKLEFEFNARDVRFDFAHDANGRALLVLADAAQGRVEVKVAKDDIRSLVLAGATAAAKQQGVNIQDFQLNLTGEGPRSIAGDVRVKAKKMMMSGTVTLRGKVDIDDNLVATLADLGCAGEGVVGSMAAAFVNGKLKSVSGRHLPLTAFSLGDVSLRDLKITTTDAVQIAADFGHKMTI